MMKKPETGWRFPDFCFVCACRDSCAFSVFWTLFLPPTQLPNPLVGCFSKAKSETANLETVSLIFYLRSHQFICVQQNLFAFKIFYLRSAQVYLRSAFFDKKIPRSTVAAGISLCLVAVSKIRTERFHFTADGGQFFERAAHHSGAFVFQYIDDKEVIS